MLRIAVGGLNRRELEAAVRAAEQDAQVVVTNDINGARLLRTDEVDYYFGACSSGGGAAISILAGLIGYGKCCTVCRNGSEPDAEEIENSVVEGKKVFGMTIDGIQKTVPLLVAACRRNIERSAQDDQLGGV